MLSLLRHTQLTYMQIKLDLDFKLSEHNAFTFLITIPTQKFKIVGLSFMTPVCIPGYLNYKERLIKNEQSD